MFLHLFMVPAFFALSGFLVTGSALRLRATAPFLTFRVLRILPALLVEVTLSALILGALFTTLPLKSYFSDPQFFRYFGNIVGLITFHLPGVFESNCVDCQRQPMDIAGGVRLLSKSQRRS
jgi:peptidoglycan/LPS O-acetylase OafA/YrhL